MKNGTQTAKIGEAVQILDGLLLNDSQLQPDTVHADTYGLSEPTFGLAILFGINPFPRMRNWKTSCSTDPCGKPGQAYRRAFLRCD